MQIDRVNPAHAAAMANAKQAKKTEKAETPQETLTSQATEETEPEKPQTQEKVKGVLRLLAEGHFKGVADVRLRINFHDEIQAMETANLRETASGSFETFNGSIEEAIAALKDSDQLSDEQLAALTAFEENLAGVQGDFLNAESLSVEALLSSLQVEWDLLAGAFAPPVEEPVAEPPVEEAAAVLPDQEESAPTEVPAEEPSAEVKPILAPEVQSQEASEETSVLDMFNALRDSFNTAKDMLASDLNNTSALPEISEPSGSGKAFEKFLAIYEQMQNGADIDLEEAETLDFEEIIVPDDIEELPL
ncbi:MAG: hypothetical protein ACYTET_04135 [Planctomycetota bacterium]|jgi:hypothetical protein